MLVAQDPASVGGSNGYRLLVSENEILILGTDPTGCFSGIQTLSQLAAPGCEHIPCLVIEDWPDFTTRGLLHDVTRGKVPTLETLKSMVDRATRLKFNQLQLYIEHAFTFGFDPDIAGPDDALTPDEIRELDGYCRERFIDLVPAVATLGHMGRILSMPRYRHLAEIEPAKSWAELGWPERARGFTLDIANPESHRLTECIWTEILDAFSSPVVNICEDEPWDLGKGRNANRWTEGEAAEAYIDHILRAREICAGRGRRVQVWSDVVRNHPELLHRLPKDLVVLHWGYDDRADYEGTRRFVEAGLETVVCPGTSGWKRIINAMDLAERNISTFASTGKEQGATGLLNTDWGDHGHFNSLACSWHGIAMGAALAWRADHATGAEFDRLFAAAVIALASPMSGGSETIPNHRSTLEEIVTSLRDASQIAGECETWRLFWQPIAKIGNDPMLPSANVAERCKEQSRKAIALLRQTSPADFADPIDREELLVACRFSELFAERIRFTHGAKGGDVEARSLGDGKSYNRADWNEGLASVAQDFAGVWRLRNKPSGLHDILTALNKVRAD